VCSWPELAEIEALFGVTGEGAEPLAGVTPLEVIERKMVALAELVARRL